MKITAGAPDKEPDIKQNRGYLREEKSISAHVAGGESEGIVDEYASKAEVIEALENAYKRDKKLQKKLLSFAKWYISMYTGNNSFGEKGANDYVQDALEDILTLKRKWKRKKIPNIENLMYLAVLSEIRNDLSIHRKDRAEEENGDETVKKRKRSEKIKKVSLTLYTSEGKQTDRMITDAELAMNYRHGEEYDEQRELEELISIVENELNEDEAAFFVFHERLEVGKKNKIIAERTGYTVSEVEAALKRIKRVMAKHGIK